MSTLDPKSPIPLHAQLESILRNNIENEVWKENDLIPSENELSREYGLSRMTVRSVILRLVQDGLLYRVPGKGTFVSLDKIVSKPISLSQMGIREQLEQMGYENTTALIGATEVPASSRVARRLQIEEHRPVFEIRRVRTVKGEPFSLHVSYIPKDCCPDFLEGKPDFEGQQLCDLLKDKYGIEQNKLIETLEIIHATAMEAELLKVKKNYPLMLLEDIIFAVNNRPIEYASVLFRGDRIKIEIKNTYSS